MPAATTHAQFADDVLKILPAEVQQRITNMPLFYLGSQGPDMLLFSKASLLPGTLKKYGNLLHEQKPLEVISYFRKKMEQDPILCSYYYGYLCHYALDSRAHPLIWALTESEKTKTGGHGGEIHVRLEAEIDVWILHQRGKSILDYDVYSKMRLSPLLAHKLAKIYHDMFLDIFAIDIPVSAIRGSIYDTSLMTRILKPGSPLKKKLVTIAEDLLHQPHPASAMMLDDKHDLTCLNLEHKTYPRWRNPDQTISASFPELYGKAVWFAKKIICEFNPDDITLNFNGDAVRS